VATLPSISAGTAVSFTERSLKNLPMVVVSLILGSFQGVHSTLLFRTMLNPSLAHMMTHALIVANFHFAGLFYCPIHYRLTIRFYLKLHFTTRFPSSPVPCAALSPAFHYRPTTARLPFGPEYRHLLPPQPRLVLPRSSCLPLCALSLPLPFPSRLLSTLPLTGYASPVT